MGRETLIRSSQEQRFFVPGIEVELTPAILDASVVR